jgi:hypothetical protein
MMGQLHEGGDQRLHDADFDAALRQTYLGQAHIAGTGPEGKTCRECKWWGKLKTDKIANPGYYAEPPRHLKQARCHRPVPHKARRVFPHTAIACRLFEAAAEAFAEARQGVNCEV